MEKPSSAVIRIDSESNSRRCNVPVTSTDAWRSFLILAPAACVAITQLTPRPAQRHQAEFSGQMARFVPEKR
jgi:hypothetical protein